MRIIVCVKQVPDSDDVKIDPKTGTLRRSEVPGVLNPADGAAVRAAVALAKEWRREGSEVTVTALTMGPPAASAVLRESMARGADEAVLLCGRSFAGADTWATSLTLAAAVRKLGDAAVIFTGKQSTDGETGHIGPQLAEHLGICQVTAAENVCPPVSGGVLSEDTRAEDTRTVNTPSISTPPRYIEATRIMDGRREHILAELPAVVSMAETDGTSGGLPIGAICDAYEKELTIWDAEALGLSAGEIGLAGSKTIVKRTFLPETEKAGERLTGNPAQMAKMLKQRLEERHLSRK